MIRRGLMIAVLLVVGGCARGDTPGASPGSTPEPSPLEDLAVSFDLTPEPPRSGEPVVWRISVTNTTDRQLTTQMPSGQKGEVVLTRDAEEVYRWSEGRFFTMALVTEQFSPGQTREYELEDEELSVDPGTYELEASSTAEEAGPPVRTRITVAG